MTAPSGPREGGGAARPPSTLNYLRALDKTGGNPYGAVEIHCAGDVCRFVARDGTLLADKPFKGRWRAYDKLNSILKGLR